MKLLKLKLFKPYRSLQFDEQKFPKLNLITRSELDPICLVGLNGCGKSNLLELIGDIFYLLESGLLNYTVARKPYVPFADNRKKQQLYFEIDYSIKINNQITYVRINRDLKKKLPSFSLFEDEKFMTLKKELDYDFHCREYLPLVVAYTSGLNDLLSMPFIELQDYYAREVTHQVKTNKNYEALIDEPNMLLLDHDSNAAIILSNYLFNSENKIKVFERFTRIDSLSSFKIVIQLNKAFGNKKVQLPTEFDKIIKDLQKCSTISSHKRNDKKGDTYEMDFVANEVTKRLFAFYFETPRKLFKALSKLNLLNTLCIQTGYRNELRNKRKEGKLLRFPIVATLDKIFRIEQIELILTVPKVRTEYIKISDGEHQFMHIVGGMLLFDEKKPAKEVLYLLDEPDTHFNPQWRSDFFKELDKIIENKNIELIITTHSPFILDDCHGYNVFIFERDAEQLVKFSRSSYETFGANFSYLLKNIFGFEHQMSDKSREHLLKLEKNIQSFNVDKKEGAIEKIEKFEKELRLYGESLEKLMVVNQLEAIKKDI